jgi:hypothetical protein
MLFILRRQEMRKQHRYPGKTKGQKIHYNAKMRKDKNGPQKTTKYKIGVISETPKGYTVHVK